jgi:SAM-dependent methyltransferase
MVMTGLITMINHIKRFFVLVNYNRRKSIIYAYFGKKCNLKILDIGCGDAGFLKYLKTKNNNYELYGVEPTLHKGVSYNEINVYNSGLIECSFKEKNFDVITMFHSIEHIPNPDKIIKEIHKILKDDGILILALPNIGSLGYKFTGKHWFHLDPLKHINQFNPESIKFLLEQCGFKIKRINYLFLEYPLDLLNSVVVSFAKQGLIRIIMKIILIFPSIIVKFMSKLFKMTETIEIISIKS